MAMLPLTFFSLNIFQQDLLVYFHCLLDYWFSQLGLGEHQWSLRGVTSISR